MQHTSFKVNFIEFPQKVILCSNIELFTLKMVTYVFDDHGSQFNLELISPDAPLIGETIEFQQTLQTKFSNPLLPKKIALTFEKCFNSSFFVYSFAFYQYLKYLWLYENCSWRETLPLHYLDIALLGADIHNKPIAHAFFGLLNNFNINY